MTRFGFHGWGYTVWGWGFGVQLVCCKYVQSMMFKMLMVLLVLFH